MMKNITYYMLFATAYCLSLLPFRVLYCLSDVFYLLLYKMVGYRRKLVTRHLRESYPEKSEEERKEIERRFYHWLCDYFVETVKLMTMSTKERRRRMEFKGIEKINSQLRNGRSVGLYIGHYCNWEWITNIPLWIESSSYCGQIYHPLENEQMNRLIQYIRSREQSINIPMAETLRKLVEFRREGKNILIGYIGDQTPFWNNIHLWLDFLNHDTPVLTGTERLLKKVGHTAFFLDMSRPRRGYYVGEIKEMSLDPKCLEDYKLTEMYFRLLEENINRAPEYYLWTHNRWKRSHEEFNLRYDEATDRVSLEPLEVIKKRKGLL